MVLTNTFRKDTFSGHWQTYHPTCRHDDQISCCPDEPLVEYFLVSNFAKAGDEHVVQGLGAPNQSDRATLFKAR